MEKGDKQAYSYHVVKVGFYFEKKKPGKLQIFQFIDVLLCFYL